MAEWVRICAEADLPPESEVGEVEAAGRVSCVARVGGAVCVGDGTCPHEGGPLGQGVLEDGRVVCPWHAFAYDLRTGVAEHDASFKVRVFEAEVRNGEVRAKV